MTIPRKGSRPIEVDGVKYRWRIRQRPTYMQGVLDHPLNLAVEIDDDPKSSLIVELAQSHPCNWLGDPAVPVTPSQVAGHIRQALDAGWQPQSQGSAFRLRIDSGS
ncbi:MAG: hypothetical protein DWQ34_10375 [Planctomycetota bacterium]|nr:MAG: hypothetical protein DWQ34_10375 [Planctomycetota bacterium]REJ95987.1 MAG: hypothetical protein DWQ29_01265 [Planctomycetota bacterium]REK22982.1 MAG: hypothetical protein DWQ41_18050 [Planctomycetota bacterium]REK28432.1 MAG: hypothetical protein DWQ45_24480 [Planctomycetota bacterium]